MPDYISQMAITIMWNLTITIVNPKKEEICLCHNSKTPDIVIVHNGKWGLESHYTGTVGKLNIWVHIKGPNHSQEIKTLRNSKNAAVNAEKPYKTQKCKDLQQEFEFQLSEYEKCTEKVLNFRVKLDNLEDLYKECLQECEDLKSAVRKTK